MQITSATYKSRKREEVKRMPSPGDIGGVNVSAIMWLVALVVFLIIEGLTSSLVCIWFAGGSVAALIISLFKVNVMVQLVVFVVVSALLLVLLRPVFKRITASKTTRTNADRVIGQNGVVIQDIDPIKGEGQVIVIGQVWSAKPEDGKSVFARDQAVVITGITGVKVLVRAKMPGE